MQAGGEQRAVDAGGELLHARIQGFAPGRLGRALDDAGIGVGFHQLHQPLQAQAGHDAVGVEDHHVAVIAAPAAAEIRDIAALALDAMDAAPVEDAAEAIQFAA